MAGKGKVIWKAIKAVGKWIAKNPDTSVEIADRVAQWKPSKDTDAQAALIGEQIDLLGQAIVELDQKVDSEIDVMSAKCNCLATDIVALREELEATRKELHMLKKILLGMGIALGVAIVAIIVSFVI